MTTCPNCKGAGTLPRDLYAEYQVATNPLLGAIASAWIRRRPQDNTNQCSVCGADGQLDSTEQATYHADKRRDRLASVVIAFVLLTLLALAMWWTHSQFEAYG